MEKRIVSLLLSMMLVICMMPAHAFASNGEPGAAVEAERPDPPAPEEETGTEFNPQRGEEMLSNRMPVYSTGIASGTCGPNLAWILDTEGTLTISGTGPMTDYDYAGSVPWYSYRSQINAVAVEAGVTGIGQNAFYDYPALASVTLPSGLESIGAYAFQLCPKLTEFTIPDSVTSVNNYALSDCNALKSITVPASVAFIGKGAFGACRALTSITVSKSNAKYASIDGVLYSKDKTELLQYPAGKSGSFPVPDGVTTIGESAFYAAESLTDISIPASLESVGDYAFPGCAALTDVYCSQTRAEWNQIRFGTGNTLLLCATIHYFEEQLTASGECGEHMRWALYQDGRMVITCTGTGVMTNYDTPGDSPWSSLRDEIICVEIQSGVEHIGINAFNGCPNLSTVMLPSGLNAISENTFRYCPKLTEFMIPDTVTFIGGHAFAECSALKSIRIPAAVTYVGWGSFAACESLTAITVDAGNEQYCDYEGVLFTKDKKDLWQYPAGKSGEYSVPSEVTTISPRSFYGAKNLTAITFSANVSRIYANAFKNCSALTDVYYLGTKEQWKSILRGEGNNPLYEATIHYEAEDPETPAIPDNLTASNKSAGVSLTWDAVSGADSYTVYRDGVQLGTCTAASYTDETAKSGSEYAYTVKAVASGESSEASSEAKIMFLSVPANVKCTNGSEGITVTWDKVDGATGYTLYRRLSTASSWTAVFTSTKATTLSKLDTGVTGGKTYYYTVRANYKSTDGNTKYYSSKAATGTKIVCSLVSALAAPTVNSIVNGFSSILVKWTRIEGAEGYYVYRKAETSDSWTKLKTVKQPASGSTVSFGNTTPKNGETYTYKVVAYNGTVLSADSNEKTYMRLTFPTLTAVSTTTGKISFSWTENAAATSFQIEYTTADTFTGATRKTLTGYKTSTAYSGFESGAEYRVRVRAYVKYWNKTEGKYMFYYGTWSSADANGESTQTVLVK